MCALVLPCLSPCVTTWELLHFHEMCCCEVLLKFVSTFHFLLKLDNNNRHFTWWPILWKWLGGVFLCGEFPARHAFMESSVMMPLARHPTHARTVIISSSNWFLNYLRVSNLSPFSSYQYLIFSLFYDGSKSTEVWLESYFIGRITGGRWTSLLFCLILALISFTILVMLYFVWSGEIHTVNLKFSLYLHSS
jgi:hypothetical protein